MHKGSIDLYRYAGRGRRKRASGYCFNSDGWLHQGTLHLGQAHSAPRIWLIKMHPIRTILPPNGYTSRCRLLALYAGFPVPFPYSLTSTVVQSIPHCLSGLSAQPFHVPLIQTTDARSCSVSISFDLSERRFSNRLLAVSDDFDILSAFFATETCTVNVSPTHSTYPVMFHFLLSSQVNAPRTYPRSATAVFRNQEKGYFTF